MKYLSFLLLLMTGSRIAIAQSKDNLYADIGLNALGGSVTYDKKVMTHLDIGLGTQYYNFNDAQYHNLQLAGFIDIRPYWKIRKNLLFPIVDIGVMYGSGREPADATISPISLCTSLGFGYCRIINKRGMGPYITIALKGYNEHEHFNDPNMVLSPRARDYSVFDATGVLSVGFKF
jgi:hypothetical protein